MPSCRSKSSSPTHQPVSSNHARWMKANGEHWENASNLNSSSKIQQVIDNANELKGALEAREEHWKQQHRRDKDEKMDLEGEVAAYQERAREDKARLEELEQERSVHIQTIADLESQLRAARFDAAKKAAMLHERDGKLIFEQNRLRHAEGEEEQLAELRRQVQKQAKLMQQLAQEAVEHKHAREELGQSYAALLKAKEQADTRHSLELQSMRQHQSLLQGEVEELSKRLQNDASAARSQLESMQLQVRTSAAELHELHGQLTNKGIEHEQQLAVARSNLHQQIIEANLQLDEARRAAATTAEQQQQQHGGEMVQLLAALREREMEAEANSARLQVMQQQLEAAAELRAEEAEHARCIMEEMKQQMELEVQNHQRQISVMKSKTADLILSAIPGESGDSGHDDNLIQSQVHELLSKLYSDEIDEDEAARQLAGMRCELFLEATEATSLQDPAVELSSIQTDSPEKHNDETVPPASPISPLSTSGSRDAVETPLPLSTSGSRDAVETPLPLSRCASGQNPAPWTFQTSFVMADQEKLMRLINKAAQIRGPQHSDQTVGQSSSWLPWSSQRMSALESKAVGKQANTLSNGIQSADEPSAPPVIATTNITKQSNTPKQSQKPMISFGGSQVGSGPLASQEEGLMGMASSLFMGLSNAASGLTGGSKPAIVSNTAKPHVVGTDSTTGLGLQPKLRGPVSDEFSSTAVNVRKNSGLGSGIWM